MSVTFHLILNNILVAVHLTMHRKGFLWVVVLTSEWDPFIVLPMGVNSLILPQNNARHMNTQLITRSNPIAVEKRHVAIVKNLETKTDAVGQSSTQWLRRQLSLLTLSLSMMLFAPLHVALHTVEDASSLMVSAAPPSALAIEIVQDSGKISTSIRKSIAVLQPDMTRPAFGNEHLVMDLSNVVTSRDRQDIANKINKIRARTGSEVCVVVTDKVSPGYTPKRMATTLFNKWKLSSTTSKKNNGVLLLVVLNDRRTEVEVGRGLNNYMGKSWCQTMLRETSSPLFKQEQYGPGILSTVRQIGSRLEEVDGSLISSTQPWKDLYSATLVGAGVLFSIYALLTETYPLDASCPSCGASGRTNWKCPGGWRVIKQATNLRPGSATKTCYCRVCQTQKSALRTIPKYDGVDSNGDYYYDSDSGSSGDSDGDGGGDSW